MSKISFFSAFSSRFLTRHSAHFSICLCICSCTVIHYMKMFTEINTTPITIYKSYSKTVSLNTTPSKYIPPPTYWPAICFQSRNSLYSNNVLYMVSCLQPFTSTFYCTIVQPLTDLRPSKPFQSNAYSYDKY